MLNRHDGRTPEQTRPVSIEVDFLSHAEGSVMVKFGNTWVLCAVSMEDRVPQFLRGTGGGWVTAEYGMLPRSTNTRTDREAARGKQSGRSQEIQRLIGRALRSVTNLDLLGERNFIVDCDVIKADGGTRTASITGACVALAQALTACEGRVAALPMNGPAAAVSVGVVEGRALSIRPSGGLVRRGRLQRRDDRCRSFAELQGTAEARYQRSMMDRWSIWLRCIRQLNDVQQHRSEAEMMIAANHAQRQDTCRR
jgi:ribonuclease PH